MDTQQDYGIATNYKEKGLGNRSVGGAGKLAEGAQPFGGQGKAGTGGQQGGDAVDVPGGSRTRKPVALAVIVALVLVCAIPVANHASDQSTYSRTTESLESKQGVATDLMLATAGVSTAVSLLSAGTLDGIANEMADISGSFAIVIGAILLEKYLLTVIGLISYRVLVPIGLVLIAISIYLKQGSVSQANTRVIGVKIIVFGIVLSLCVPLSVFISDMVGDAYSVTTENKIEQTKNSIREFVSASDESADDASLLDKIRTGANKALQGIANVPAAAQALLAGIVEVFAMTVVLNCVIPLLTTILFLWLSNCILGTKIPIPRTMPKVGSGARKRVMSATRSES